MPLQLREGLLREVFAVLREHGAGREECVVYLTGKRSVPGLVDELLHPVHHARADHYEIDPAWLNQTWLDLADTDREIRLQVHTHGREAFHSLTDDGFPIVQTPGFLSLVIPYFAMGRVALDRAFLAELHAGGQWVELDPSQELVAS